VPHLLVPEVVRAMADSAAQTICVVNLWSDRETAGFTPCQHLEVLFDHAPQLGIDAVIADPRFSADDHSLETYAHQIGSRLLVTPVGARDGTPVHDPLLLAAAFADVMDL
jgi:2-phospho-L-lactate transferase/gluconeogenesis factor (CofD/UPF0052 family)